MANKLNDATQDVAQLVDGLTAVGDNSFGQSDIFDLKQADPCDFNVRLEWVWTAVPGAVQFVSVIGSTDAAGTNSYLLASKVLGEPATVATVLGFTPSGDFTGYGAHLIRCSNVAKINTIASGGEQATVICRYIRIGVQCAGSGSEVTFVARIDHN